MFWFCFLFFGFFLMSELFSSHFGEESFTICAQSEVATGFRSCTGVAAGQQAVGVAAES